VPARRGGSGACGRLQGGGRAPRARPAPRLRSARAGVASRADGPSPVAERRARGGRAASGGGRGAARRPRARARGGAGADPSRPVPMGARPARRRVPGLRGRTGRPRAGGPLAGPRPRAPQDRGHSRVPARLRAVPGGGRARGRDRRAGLRRLRARLGAVAPRHGVLRHCARVPPARSVLPGGARQGLRDHRRERPLQRDLGPRAQPRGRPGRAHREVRDSALSALDVGRRIDREEPGVPGRRRPS
jgi:hypothetical protein